MSSPVGSKALASAFESSTFGEDSSFHVEQPVGSMSISPCGRDVVLASKEGLHIIDLDSPYSPPRYLPHHIPWEVADVQWSPFAARDSWVVSTSNQKALVWNLEMRNWENSIEHVLHAHSRAITDINFSAHYPDILATCAVDSFVHCWDLRVPARPVISFSDWFAGATQVKWNRQDPHVIASTHDKYLRVWDDRMGAYPIKSIEAHSTKIYGVDWNRVRPGALVTCSLDKTIKFWDYMSEHEVPEHIIGAPFPVWRARHTPFGWGVLAMPQRGNSDLHLYSRRATEGSRASDSLPLVHSFPGHKGQVKEFLWRPRGAVITGVDHREFQLVSWGTDRELRLHRVDPELLQDVGYEKGKSFEPTLNITRKGAVYKTFRDEPREEDSRDSLDPETGVPPEFNYSGRHRLRLSAGISMNTMSMPFSRAWAQVGSMNSNVGMQGRPSLRSEMNPISWMRGVKISGWDIETLGDEITHVGEKFSKVAFESVDIRQRKVTISLHGPWNIEGAPLFLKVDIKFPIEYPRTAVPLFNIQKTAAMTDQLAAKISAELQTISETYLTRNRGCLEGALRYLLGERNLEESIVWVLGETTDPLKYPINDLGQDESSDEDEEVGQFQNQDSLEMSSELLRPVHANIIPVAKACGASWSHSGRLVCFFPPKQDKSASLFNSIGFGEMTRLSRNEKVFEGFGRLQTSSPGHAAGTATLTITATDDGASDFSDDASTMSSSSSSSSDIISGLPSRFQVPQTWRNDGSFCMYQLSRSAGNSQRSTAGATAISDAPHNIVSIYEFSDLLPAKQELAGRYRIFGNGADVCAHNAAVAMDAGHYDLVQVWGLLKLILCNQTPCLHSDNRRVSHKIYRKDSGIDLNQDLTTTTGELRRTTTPSSTQRSEHYVGGLWLVPALFDYFERIGDVQMLAMLSCIFHGQSLRKHPPQSYHRRDRKTFNHPEQPVFSVDSFSPREASGSKSQGAASFASMLRESNPAPTVRNAVPTADQSNSASTTTYSINGTPPIAAQNGQLILERKSLSISASPDHHSIIRSGSGLGATLASSLSRSFTFGHSSSSSPPVSSNIRKKASPSGSLHTPAAASGWIASGLFSKAVSAIPDYLTASTALTSQTHSDTESERRFSQKAPMKMKLTLKNQDSFDDEGHAQNQFIDYKKNWLYKSYCAAYADLLFVWGLPVEQSEVLKVGACDQYANHSNRWSHRPSQRISLSFSAPKRDDTCPVTFDSSPQELGLDIQRHCPLCGHALHISVFSTPARGESTTGNKINVNRTLIACPQCKTGQSLPTKLPCIVCGEAIDGMFTPCLSCGHVSCFACHHQWFSQKPSNLIDLTSNDSELRLCPSGCGCSCTEHEVISVPMPVSLPPLPENDNKAGLGSRKGSPRWRSKAPSGHNSFSAAFQVGQVGQAGDDLEVKHSSPLAALGRGLGGGLSRGFRARDDRGKALGAAAAKKITLDRLETI